MTARDEAAAWLRQLLAGGPVAVNEVRRLAGSRGHAWRTMQRSKRTIGAEAQRVGRGGLSRWVWRLGKDAKSGALADGRRWHPIDDLIDVVARVQARGGIARMTRRSPAERREMLALEFGRLAGELDDWREALEDTGHDHEIEDVRRTIAARRVG